MGAEVVERQARRTELLGVSDEEVERAWIYTTVSARTR
jgi:hypothetical protein